MPLHDDTADEILEQGAMARPYLLTQGRTRSEAGDLAVEAMVATRADADTPSDLELAAIYHLCLTPNSIAEISAKRSIPLGVARVLVADMWGAGTLELLETTRTDDIAVVRRLLDGIRRR